MELNLNLTTLKKLKSVSQNFKKLLVVNNPKSINEVMKFTMCYMQYKESALLNLCLINLVAGALCVGFSWGIAHNVGNKKCMGFKSSNLSAYTELN